jgi:cell division FtsZ-interacting protein ZapD
MASLTDAADAFEFPLTPGMTALLDLEELMADLARARSGGDPRWCHLVAARLGERLPALGPDGLGETLLPEAHYWIRFLDSLAERPGADGGKVARMRAALESLTERLGADWPDYFRCLRRDPWLAPYAEDAGAAILRPSPRAWAALGDEARGGRLEAWENKLEPLGTLAEAVLRLTRDSLQWQEMTVPPEGAAVSLPAAPATGLVRVRPGADGLVPALHREGPASTLRILAGPDLDCPPDPVQASLGWFTL